MSLFMTHAANALTRFFLPVLIGIFLSGSSYGQNPATTFEIPNRTINLPCGTNCTPISATVPHIKQSTDYIVIPAGYQPFPWVTAAGIDVTVLIPGGNNDDQWTPVISMPFPFCFYGNTFNSLVRQFLTPLEPPLEPSSLQT